MMKAGKLCVSAIFRPVPSVAKSGKYVPFCSMFRVAYMITVLKENEKADNTTFLTTIESYSS